MFLATEAPDFHPCVVTQASFSSQKTGQRFSIELGPCSATHLSSAAFSFASISSGFLLGAAVAEVAAAGQAALSAAVLSILLRLEL